MQLTILEQMRRGTLPNPYELQPSDEGKRIDWFDFGYVTAFDIGRCLFLSGKVLQMESRGQMERRKGGKQHDYDE